MASNKKELKFAVFIIAYNASHTIIDVYKRIPEDVKTKAEEIYVIDDCSQDPTYEKILDYKKRNGLKKLKIFRNKFNLGYGGNQKKGYDYAIKKGFDCVIMLHGDAQYAPEKIMDILSPFNGENERIGMVMGSRMLGDPLKGGMPLHKFIGNKFLTFIQNLLLGTNLSEFHSGYRCYSCKVLSEIPYLLCSDGFSFDTEIIIMLLQRGYKIKEVEIPTFYGNEICHVPLVKYGLDCLRAVFESKVGQIGLAEFEKYSLSDPKDRNYIYLEKKSPYSSHSKINTFIQKKFIRSREKRILDLGCGIGTLSEEVVVKNEVIGIDKSRVIYNTKRLSHAYNLKVDDFTKIKNLGLGSFDTIIAADILEHLVSPEQVLNFYSKYLKSKGFIIVSVPNVANIFVRLGLLLGNFNYTNSGILDRTHLRFFTKKSIINLLRLSGFEIKDVFCTPIPFEMIFPGLMYFKKQSVAQDLLNGFTNFLPGLLAYQFIVVGGKKTDQKKRIRIVQLMSMTRIKFTRMLSRGCLLVRTTDKADN